MTPTTDHIGKFVDACIAKGEGEESGNTKQDRKHYEIIHSSYLRLKEAGRLEELLELLNHENPYVRLWAASYTLQIAPAKAERTLEELSCIRGVPAGFSASITLKEWRAGRLNL